MPCIPCGVSTPATSPPHTKQSVLTLKRISTRYCTLLQSEQNYHHKQNLGIDWLDRPAYFWGHFIFWYMLLTTELNRSRCIEGGCSDLVGYFVNNSAPQISVTRLSSIVTYVRVIN